MKKTKCWAGMILLFFFIHIMIFAQNEPEATTFPSGKKYPVNLSLYYPVSLNQSKHDEVNLNLSLIYSRVGYVYGCDFSLIGSAISHRLEGIQICGLGAVVGESGLGIQVAGLAAVAGDNFSGLQIAGLANVVGEEGKVLQLSGLANVVGNQGTVGQISGLFNVAGEGFSGFQASAGFNVGGGPCQGLQVVGLFNVVGERFSGIQVGGLFNIVGENLDGAQFAGLFNVCGEELKGLQTGVFNIAAEQNGAQIGVANIGGTNRGLQLGLVNYTKEENLGLPVGAVNIARNGRIRGVAWAGSQVAVSGGIKFEVGRIYSIVSLGAFNLKENIRESLAYGLHYGVTLRTGRWNLHTDIGYRYQDNAPLFRNPEDQPDRNILEWRFFGGIPLSERLSIVLGSGIGHSVLAGDHEHTGNTYPLLLAGLEFSL